MKRDSAPLLNPALRADQDADDAVAAMLAGADGDPEQMFKRIHVINTELQRWDLNGNLDGWRASPGVDPAIAAALEAYVATGRVLPDWAEPDKIARAENLFMDMSMLSCTLLFCASLPECYVLPDLSEVLHMAGQLELHTDYRVRSTAAMIFPVMMRGGMCTPEGGGVAQALKVRLIHATIRHLILRGSPENALGADPIPELAVSGPGMHRKLYAHGWNSAQDGLPVNQEQLAYTLLTFGYVFLLGLRRLGLGLPRKDEEAYLHAWNVLGHVIGIERELMSWTMEEAAARFEAMQARGRLLARQPDPRPWLAEALMRAMENEIPLRVLKPFPTLLTRRLIGKESRRDLGLTARVSLISRALFLVAFWTVRIIDKVVRIFFKRFSISRMLTRIAGYRLVTRFLMDQTRPLKLPMALQGQVHDAIGGWGHDPCAPQWMNRLESHLACHSLTPREPK